MTHPRHGIRKFTLKRVDIHVGLMRRGGGGGTSGPSFPRPRSPHPLLPSFLFRGESGRCLVAMARADSLNARFQLEVWPSSFQGDASYE
jgi:hypothetical protein